jgi:putative metallohydrolase (TIGR04338 family)
MKDQQGRLYRAENLSGLKGKEEFTLKECERYLNRVWRKKYVQGLRGYGLATSANPQKVGVTDGRRRRSACASYRLGIPTVTLPKWGRHEYVMLHELAHLVAGLGNEHNPKFATVLVTLVRRELGKESAERLVAGYALTGVKVISASGKVIKARCPKSQREWFEGKKKEIEEINARVSTINLKTAEVIEAIEKGEPFQCPEENCQEQVRGEKYFVRLSWKKVQTIWEAKCVCGKWWTEFKNEIYKPEKHDGLEFAKGRYGIRILTC